MFNVLERIDELRNARGYSIYRICKETGIPQSTFTTWYSRNIEPPIEAVEKVCNLFGITLAEFFCTDTDIENAGLATNTKEISEKYQLLNTEQKQVILSVANAFLSDNTNSSQK